MIYGDTFGELLEKNRLDKNVLKNKLCRGLCSSVALLRYEQDERIPEKIMADSLLERLGIKPYQFEFPSVRYNPPPFRRSSFSGISLQ